MGLLWAVLFGFLPLARALNTPDSFTLDFPLQADLATPTWLGHPEMPERVFAALDLPIIPPNADNALLVTVFFQEKQGGFLRLIWQGPQGAQTLSDNFFEGIGMSNQRSLLIDATTLQGPGTLSLVGGDSTLDIQRIKLEWLETRPGLTSPQIEDILVTPETGATTLALSLAGQPPQVNSANWRNRIVTVPVTDEAQRIEQGVEFQVQMDSLPRAARLSLQEAGLPWGQHIVVWINQQRAGTITPAVPDLTDGGFTAASDSINTFVGWRAGAIYVPVSLLKSGVNAVQFSVEDEGDPTSANTSAPALALPFAVKEVALQLSYDVVSESSIVPDPGAAAQLSLIPEPSATADTAGGPAASANKDTPSPLTLNPSTPPASNSAEKNLP